MAGDWIKVSEDIHEKPEVLQMAMALETRPEYVVGYCLRWWAWVSRNCPHATVTNVRIESIESVLNVPGFLRQLIEVGWLEYGEPDGVPTITIPNFERHLSQGAKRRALDAERQRSNRKKKSDKTGQVSASHADVSRTREEKRREDNNSLSPTENICYQTGLPYAVDSLECDESLRDSLRLFEQMCWEKHGEFSVTQQQQALLTLAQGGLSTEKIGEVIRRAIEFGSKYLKASHLDDKQPANGKPKEEPFRRYRVSEGK